MTTVLPAYGTEFSVESMVPFLHLQQKPAEVTSADTIQSR